MFCFSSFCGCLPISQLRSSTHQKCSKSSVQYEEKRVIWNEGHTPICIRCSKNLDNWNIYSESLWVSLTCNMFSLPFNKPFYWRERVALYSKKTPPVLLPLSKLAHFADGWRWGNSSVGVVLRYLRAARMQPNNPQNFSGKDHRLGKIHWFQSRWIDYFAEIQTIFPASYLSLEKHTPLHPRKLTNIT